jgi:PadR family transcriptional regulator PadR
MGENNGNFLRGVIELLILSILKTDDCYGYQLTNLINNYSDGLLNIPTGTLYQPLYRLQEKGYISVEQIIVEKRLRTYYHLEESGKEYFDSIKRTYEDINEGVQKIFVISDKRSNEDK